MLMVTESARQAIESFVANADMPEGSGLRIDAPDEPPAPSRSGAPLQLEVASGPTEQDQVVSEGGAKVFVSPRVAPLLDDKLLDVRVSEGKVQFVIAPQQGQPGEPGRDGQSEPGRDGQSESDGRAQGQSGERGEQG
jgi:Fe-S cluster assembly iron-binding protein IscA